MNNYAFLGIVQKGRFKPLATERKTGDLFRLTSIPIRTGQPPEKGELSLAKYEGSAILVRGMDNGEWIHSAIVVDQAGLILTAVVQQVFNTHGKRGQYRLTFPLG